MYATKWKAYIWHLIAMHVAADLQITRKSCIQRFLEKHHERIHGKSPDLPPPQKRPAYWKQLKARNGSVYLLPAQNSSTFETTEGSKKLEPLIFFVLHVLWVSKITWNLSFLWFCMYCGYQKSLKWSSWFLETYFFITWEQHL